ncbi:MAG: YkvA family protein [Terrimicrobiaceae bacterium]
MTIKPTNTPKPREGSLLAAYMTYVSNEGINLERFVEHGGRLLTREDATGLAAGLAHLRDKTNSLRGENPRLGRQLDFLERFFKSAPADVPEAVRNETFFALLYAVKDVDLMPDDMPGVGFLDDAAVTEVVLSRNAREFERFCAVNDIEWAALKPETHR